MDTIRASEEAAARHGATLEALAFAAQRLLEEPDWQRVIAEIIRRLAVAVDVSRAYVYENRPETDELRAVLRAQWVATDDLAVVTEGTELGYEGLDRWVTTLGAGEILAGPVAGFPASERPTLEAHHVQSDAEKPVAAVFAVQIFRRAADQVEEIDWLARRPREITPRHQIEAHAGQGDQRERDQDLGVLHL